MNIKDNKGITLILLVVTIIVLLIIAGVTITAGTESIKKAKLETLRTNMLLIKAKGKEYCEEANFKVGIINESDTDEVKAEKIQKGKDYLKNPGEDKKGLVNEASAEDLASVNASLGEDAINKYAVKLSTQDLKDIGLNEVANTENTGDFIIVFDIKNNTVEVYNTQGYKDNNQTKYSLTEIEAIED
ncbi:MAG: hypothetical protein IJJ82_02480 [Clostridia bacterium]|nr:hypothetical protein [Clostridia bacterium]